MATMTAITAKLVTGMAAAISTSSNADDNDNADDQDNGNDSDNDNNSENDNACSPGNGTVIMSTAVTKTAAANLLPINVATMLSGKGCESGTHLAALGRTVPGQVVCVIIAQ